MSKLLAILFVGITFIASAQEKKFNFGVSASLDWNSYAFSEEPGQLNAISYRGRLGYSTGFVVKFKLSDQFSLRSGLSYSRKAFAEVTDYSKLNPQDPLLKDKKSKSIFVNHFIEVPLYVHYYVTQANTSYALLGVISSSRFSYEYKGTPPNSVYDGIKYNRHLLAAAFGWGFQFNLNMHSLAIEPQFRYYVTEVHDKWLTKNPVYFGVEVSLLKL
jgi:hypothetical protein